MITHLERWFKDVYNPNKEVAVDEAMIKFEGCSSLKQHMPMKHGIKAWCLAVTVRMSSSHLSKSTRGKKNNSVEKGLGGHVVKDLTEGKEPLCLL